MIALADGGVVRVLPELALVLGLVAILVVDLVPSLRRAGPWLGIVACGAGLLAMSFGEQGGVGSMLAVDGVANLARLLILPVAAL
ncbi:MAG: hypothetical protein WAT39_19610, partial [Planctomycetota bacterium]